MTREEIDAAIKRHADFELLYDKPFEDNKKVRVAGPFTVESLSPHRSLAFARRPGAASRSRDRGREGRRRTELRAVDPRQPRQGRHPERPPAGADQVRGVRDLRRRVHPGDRAARRRRRTAMRRRGSRSRSARSTAPSARRSSRRRRARRSTPRTSTCSAILGFAFDPQVTGVTEDDGVTVEATDEGFASVAGVRKLGRIPVLMVRMNADLLMGEELKKTGAGNLFTVFGEPDIDMRRDRRRHRRRPQGRRRLRPDHRRGAQQRHRPDRALDDRHRLRRGVVLRPALLLHRRQRPVQAAQDRAQGRHRRGGLGLALPDRSRGRSRSPRPARSPSRSSTTTATKS